MVMKVSLVQKQSLLKKSKHINKKSDQSRRKKHTRKKHTRKRRNTTGGASDVEPIEIQINLDSSESFTIKVKKDDNIYDSVFEHLIKLNHLVGNDMYRILGHIDIGEGPIEKGTTYDDYSIEAGARLNVNIQEEKDFRERIKEYNRALEAGNMENWIYEYVKPSYRDKLREKTKEYGMT